MGEARTVVNSPGGRSDLDYGSSPVEKAATGRGLLTKRDFFPLHRSFNSSELSLQLLSLWPHHTGEGHSWTRPWGCGQAQATWLRDIASYSGGLKGTVPGKIHSIKRRVFQRPQDLRLIP